MGPTFVKLGQLLSTRSDLLPPSHLAGGRPIRRRVLVMDEVGGRKMTELGRFGRLEVDGTRLAFFLVAAVCGLGLIVSVVLSDRHVKARTKRGRRT